ncbi:MAG: DNA/RNA non-specific endonuclease [Muribaculaceae bacterium]|nr:DNA/RNA non-specific endonuclease [Muribaculaceae bacterium]
MSKTVEQLWQRWGDTVRFLGWGLTVALVCFLLYRVAMRDYTTHPVPLSEGGRDSLMTVGTPHGMSDTLLNYGEAFAVHFNSERGIANCAAYELVSNELNGTAERRNEFIPDPGVKGCPTPADYAGSGMDRGHLVPAADLKWSPDAMRQSFLMTNIAPMHKALNEGGWAKLEEKVREWTARDSALLVFTGPVVSEGDTTLASGRVTVPSAYYKVIVAPCVSPRRAIAFIYPNGHSGGRLRQYAVSVDEVERRTGLNFFPTLSDEEQQQLESRVSLDLWVN